jgi:hypothetical protein
MRVRINSNSQGYRPSKTTHQILSLSVFAVEVRICYHKEWYFTDE